MSVRWSYTDRDACANLLVSIWRDAIAEGFDMAVLHRKFDRVYKSKQFKRLPSYARAYVEGYQRSYDVNVVQRQFQESGSFVNMPDGSVQYFGVAERLGMSAQQLEALHPECVSADCGIHGYLYKHTVPHTCGIYWIAREPDPKLPWRASWKAGERPFHIEGVTFLIDYLYGRQAPK